jgi:hypothetical protein
MIFLSFNAVWGRGCPKEAIPQKNDPQPKIRHHPHPRDNVLWRESQRNLHPLAWNWSFITIDASGLSGGLLTGWSPNFQALSSSVARSTISIKLQHKNNNLTFSVVNIYGLILIGPPSGRIWSMQDFFSDPFLVVGGDLNLTLSLREVWGAHPRVDRKSVFFQSFFEKANLVDIEPVKLSPTWRNFRTGDEEVAKRLDRFLVSEALLNLGTNFQIWSRGGRHFRPSTCHTTLDLGF